MHALTVWPDPDPTVAPLLPMFVLNFSTEVDCKSILPYGNQQFPAENVAGHLRNYRSLPFPLRISACQPMRASGSQTTRDRPFTIAEVRAGHS